MAPAFQIGRIKCSLYSASLGVFALQTLVSFFAFGSTLSSSTLSVSGSTSPARGASHSFRDWFWTMWWLFVKTLEELPSFFRADTFGTQIVVELSRFRFGKRGPLLLLWSRGIVIILESRPVYRSLLFALQPPRVVSLCSFGTPRAALGRKDLAECGATTLRGAESRNEGLRARVAAWRTRCRNVALS